MRLFIAVSLTEITVIGTSLKVTVFQKIFRILRSSCSQVYCHHHIAAGFSGPVHKLIESKLVCLDDTPGQLRSGRTLSFRPDTILPTESGYKISARITNDRYLKLPYQFQSILPKSLLIRKGAAFLINPLINRTSEMFYKGTIDPFVCFSGEEIFVHDDLRFFHCKNPPVNYYFLPATALDSVSDSAIYRLLRLCSLTHSQTDRKSTVSMFHFTILFYPYQ